MGVWGVKSFDNDASLDWLFDFGDNDFRLIDRTLASVAGMMDVDELDAYESYEALAAAECVAAAGGYPAAELPEDLEKWLDANMPIRVKPDFVIMARKAVRRVRTNSELKELWEGTDEGEEWHAAVADLQNRLAQIPVASH